MLHCWASFQGAEDKEHCVQMQREKRRVVGCQHDVSCMMAAVMRALQAIPVLTGLLPIIAIHSTYLIAAGQGYVPWCFPYLESCTSISATGREGIAYFVFKGTMIPSACLLVIYWYLSYRWLRALGDVGQTPFTLFVLGAIGAVFLVVYTVALGGAGDWLQLQRRIGVILYFTLTYLSQLLLIWRLFRLGMSDRVTQGLLGLAVTSLSIGIATLILDVSIDNYDNYEDAFEWILALLIHLHFLLGWWLWRKTGFSIRFNAGTY